MPLTTVRQVSFLLGAYSFVGGLGGWCGGLPWFGSFRMTFVPCAVPAIAHDRQSKQMSFVGDLGEGTGPSQRTCRDTSDESLAKMI